MAETKWTPEIRGAIIERIAAGLTQVDACRAVGVREKTVKNWVTRGRREESGEYAEFVRRVEEAREQAANRPEPMDAEELARVVSEMARKGSVQAAKLRYEMLTANADEEPEEDGDRFDELKARRRRAA